MSIINPLLRSTFESALMSSSNCIIPEEHRLSMRKISNRTDINLAVKEVYFHRNTLWAHARGGKGCNRLTNTGSIRVSVEDLLDTIGERIYKYFNDEPNVSNTRESFDDFHKSLCSDFLKGINAIRDSVNYSHMSYGQAQKLINLSFKYISCYSDYMDYADLFTHCHMVIDNKVLTNLSKSNLSTMFARPITSSITYLSGGRFRGKGWTDFSDTDYLALLKEYRRVIDPYMENLTYIELEYSMWPTLSAVTTTGTMPLPISRFHV